MTDPNRRDLPHLTRSDFEAILWDHLHQQVARPIADVLAALDANAYDTLTVEERAAFLHAWDRVKERTGRLVWDVNA